MKFQVLRNVPAESLTSRVRPAFRDRIPVIRPDDMACTLIVFRFQRDEKASGVVTSNAVKQALNRLGDVPNQRILAFAGDFTQEARALLKENRIEAVTLTYFGWTDERYAAIRNPNSG